MAYIIGELLACIVTAAIIGIVIATIALIIIATGLEKYLIITAIITVILLLFHKK